MIFVSPDPVKRTHATTAILNRPSSILAFLFNRHLG